MLNHQANAALTTTTMYQHQAMYIGLISQADVDHHQLLETPLTHTNSALQETTGLEILDLVKSAWPMLQTQLIPSESTSKHPLQFSEAYLHSSSTEKPFAY